MARGTDALQPRHGQEREVGIIRHIKIHIATVIGTGTGANTRGKAIERSPEQACEASQAMDQLGLGQVSQVEGERVDDLGQLSVGLECA